MLAARGTTFLILFTVEGVTTEAYAKTAVCKEEKRYAVEKHLQLYQHSQNVAIQNMSLAGFNGMANLGLLGAVGYVMFVNNDRPEWWDHCVATAITGGFLGSGQEKGKDLLSLLFA